jgi:predicted phosphodiesterase
MTGLPPERMRSRNPLGTELVTRGCTDWPNLPSRTLARKLFNDNPGVWESIETARMAVTYRRGRRKAVGQCKNPLPSSVPNVPWNPEAYLPESDEKAFTPHIVDVAKDSRALVMGDIHVPYHNIPAVSAALRSGQKSECNIVILNGDTLDFHRLSRFQKDPKSRNPKIEIERANQILDAIDDMFPKARKIFKDGNHDERYDNYISAHAAEVFDVIKELASLDKLLELQSRGWEYVSEKRPIYLGKLTVLHGHEMPASIIGPVNAARGLFLRTKASAFVNHHHQVSEHSEPDIRGKLITTWSGGCLCDLHPMYARYNKWSHGFAEIDLSSNGEFEVSNRRVIDGKVY